MAERLRVVLMSAPEARTAATPLIEADGDIQVVGHAYRPGQVPSQPRPDVLAVDLAGGPDAVDLIEQIMSEHPLPILALTHLEAEPTPIRPEEALAAGAAEVLPWPAAADPASTAAVRRTLRLLRGLPTVRRRPRHTGARRGSAKPVIGIAASTGGPSAVAELLGSLFELEAPILLVQHIHPTFVSAFVGWLAGVTGGPVELAENGTTPRPGVVYVGPAGLHLKLGDQGLLRLDPEPKSLHRPSADEMFLSMAATVGRAGIGIVLTGMGDDGARGLLALRRAGGRTITQDEQTSAIFGMPAAAERLGASTVSLPLSRIAATVGSTLRELRR